MFNKVKKIIAGSMILSVVVGSTIMAQLSRQKFDVFIMNWYVDGLHGKCGAAFPGFLYYAAALAASRSITG